MPGKPRKVRLSPLAGDILLLLSELGEETLPTIANTFAKAQDITWLEMAVRELWSAGFVELRRDVTGPGMLSVRLEAGEAHHALLLRELLHRDASAGLWQWSTPSIGG